MESHGQSGAPIDKFYIDRNTSNSVKISPNPFGICAEHLEQGLVTNNQLLVRRIGTRVLIRLALLRAGITGKVIGWHTFRHSLATNLRSMGVDIKIAQSPLRHANSRITMNLYTQAVSADKRLASGRQIEMLMGDVNVSEKSIVPLRTADFSDVTVGQP